MLSPLTNAPSMRWLSWKSLLPCMALSAMALLLGCASDPFYSSWKAPDAVPLQVEGSRVAAVVMMKGEGSRRAAEDALARELTARGATGVPLYVLLPDISPENETEVHQALANLDIEGVVVMRPVRTQTEVESRPTHYAGPRYTALWGGYYGYGWGASWDMAVDVRTDTIVYVETLVYSMKQNKLVWGGQSKTTNPSNVERLVHDTARKVARELERLGLITL